MDRWADRDCDGVESAARAILADATAPEARIRLRGVLDHIAADRLMHPTLITMHMLTDARRRKRCMKKLFLPNRIAAGGVSSGCCWRRITNRLTVNADRMPFWDVVSQLDVQSHVQLVGDIIYPPILSRRNRIPQTGRRLAPGHFGFLLVTRTLEFPQPDGGTVSTAGRPFVLTFDCWTEPGRPAVAISNEVSVREAVDDRGNSLVPGGGDVVRGWFHNMSSGAILKLIRPR